MKRLELAGRKFGRLCVIKLDETNKSGYSKWECICECGNRIKVRGSNLMCGTTQSCGCLRNEMTTKATKTHGRSYDSEYNIWNGIKTRCLNKADKAYPKYGGRGITMCDTWINSFENFIADVGNRPNMSLTIERRNNDLGYCKSNCYWGTKTEQSRNRSCTVWLEYNGLRLPQTEWSKRLNTYPGNIKRKLKKGIPFPEIVKHLLNINSGSSIED